MSLAQTIRAQLFLSPSGFSHLYEHRNDFWAFRVPSPTSPPVWQVLDRKLIEDEVWKWLAEAWVRVERGAGAYVVQRLDYSTPHVTAIMRCLEAISRCPSPRLPCWLREGEGVDPEFCTAFHDVVVDLQATAHAGTPVTFPRTDAYFDCVTVPCGFEPSAPCPTWRECNRQWGAGDSVWTTLNQRQHGYGLMGFRGFAKWFMNYGVTRTGKGTNERIRQAMIGDYGYVGLRMSALGRQFGLHKLARARVIVISEVTELEKRIASEGGGLLKSILGQDPIDLDRKYHDPLENITVRAMVILQGNELPHMPNKGRSLTSKMVPLNFDVTFEGQEDVMLERKLLGELPGIAAWSLQGAVDLLRAPDGASRWPITEGARFVIHKFHMLNNPADGFLAWGFTKAEGGFVASQIVWERYLQWCQFMKIKSVGRQEFNGWLEAQNSWNVVKGRVPGGGRHGFRGLGLKMVTGYSDEDHASVL